MKKYLTVFVLILLIFSISGCSNEVVFHLGSDDITLTYNGSDYSCVSENECEYKYNEKDMVYLSSVKLPDSDESYNVYRHVDDKTSTYLFVIPKPSIFRDVTPYSYILKIKSQ